MELKVISFNIRCCDDPDGHSIPERAPRLKSTVCPLDADVIGIQECRPLWEGYLEEYFGSEYDTYSHYRSIDCESVPLFWRRDRFECLDKGHFWLSDTPDRVSKGWDSIGCYRICVFAILKDKKTGKTFAAVNTHFGFGDECQLKSVDLITKRMAEFGLPYFITGDFNMTPESKGYAAITKHLCDVNAATVNDKRDTYHAYEPSKFRNEHIDYCFVSREFKPLDQRILDESVDGKYPSDHFGIISLVEL